MDWKKIWHFIWHEDSVASWVVNIILAFVIIKFIIFPVLGFALGTSHPIVAVISGSMEHDITKEYQVQNGRFVWTGKYVMCGNRYDKSERVNFDFFWEECGPWYEERGISKESFKDFSFKNGFNKGDIIVLVSKKNVEVGNVIVFWSNRKDPIIHRVVEIDDGFITKGDHNGREDGSVNEENVIGKALFRIPLLGWVKIWFVNILNLFIGG